MTKLELKLPPALLSAMWALAIYGLATSFPATRLAPSPPLTVAALIAALLGGVIACAGVWAFLRSRTSISPTRPQRASRLVTTGVYRLTRNPMYLGLLLLLLAWTLYLRQPLGVLTLPLFVLTMTRLQIVPEERVLAEVFGKPYTDYKARVRRWL